MVLTGLRFSIALFACSVIGTVLGFLGVAQAPLTVMLTILIMPVPAIYHHFAHEANHIHAPVSGNLLVHISIALSKFSNVCFIISGKKTTMRNHFIHNVV